MEPRASDDDVENHPRPPPPNPPCNQKTTTFLPDFRIAARLSNCFSPAAPELAPLLPVAEAVTDPAPASASSCVWIDEPWCYWFRTWFLVLLYCLVFPGADLVQVVVAMFLLQYLVTIVMHKYIIFVHC
jgi:hypothetical protein